jgi:DNA (cytosine-5)-methyltransferase 1
MEYWERLLAKDSKGRKPKIISLFTGAGGFDYGLEQAGFSHSICVEWDADCRKTLKLNRPKWKLSEPGDIHKVKPSDLLKQAGLKKKEADLLVGGPPCQPFSKAAFWVSGDTARLKDPRAKTLTAYLNVVEAALPEVLILENVKGLTYKEKNEGLKLLLSGLKRINKRNKTNYQPFFFHINVSTTSGLAEVFS